MLNLSVRKYNPNHDHIGRFTFSKSNANFASYMASQAKWLDAHARARGYRLLDDFIHSEPDAFEQLTANWRKRFPAPSQSAKPPEGSVLRGIFNFAAGT